MEPPAAAEAPSAPIEDMTARVRRSASPAPGLSTLGGCARPPALTRVQPCGGGLWSALGLSAGVPLPARINPSAILHSNVAMFNSEQAQRTRLTARISSDVSITTMGVEELIRTFRRLSPSGIGFSLRQRLEPPRTQRHTKDTAWSSLVNLHVVRDG